MENQMMYPYYPYDGRHQGRGMAATGIGLAAGLGGAALIGVLLTAWGVNKASEARASANQNSLNNLAALTLAERTSRETWQNNHAPTLTQYVDVRAGAGAGANALSVAEALALQNGGINSAIGRDCYLRVQRYSAPQPCGCDTCNG
jgi:Na+(H+)/acetate symporter ActP